MPQNVRKRRKNGSERDGTYTAAKANLVDGCGVGRKMRRRRLQVAVPMSYTQRESAPSYFELLCRWSWGR